MTGARRQTCPKMDGTDRTELSYRRISHSNFNFAATLTLPTTNRSAWWSVASWLSWLSWLLQERMGSDGDQHARYPSLVSMHAQGQRKQEQLQRSTTHPMQDSLCLIFCTQENQNGALYAAYPDMISMQQLTQLLRILKKERDQHSA